VRAQAHYVLHCCDPLLQRAAAVRSLGAVRAVQEQQLMRHNSDGTKQLDHKGAELLLKIIQMQDKQLVALDASRMPPPPARGSGGGGR
jgi:hemin uptake protein HemP